VSVESEQEAFKGWCLNAEDHERLQEEELRRWAIEQARQFVHPGVRLEVLLDTASKLISYVKAREEI
jgi:hypothetical protein